MIISTLGAIFGLVVAIFLIIKKINPFYSLLLGAIVGGIIGGASLDDTLTTIIAGSQSIMPSVLRILCAGVLAGVLIKSGAAWRIADQIITSLGIRRVLFALSLSTMILTSIGVFIDVAVITVAPIGLALAHKTGIKPTIILLALIGGGKAGNIISPNPNTITTAENFGVELSSLMVANLIPSICALFMTLLITTALSRSSKFQGDIEIEEASSHELPGFWASLIGPAMVIFLLSLRSIANIAIDPMLALPIGGLIGAVAMKKTKHIPEYLQFGMQKMMPVAILLIGTGAVAGIIQASYLQQDTILLLNSLNLPAYFLAPISGILMGGATASTTAGAAIASATFSDSIVDLGISLLGGAAMVHSGATVIDSLPHGSFFHATAGAANIDFASRLKLIPFEIAIGLTSTIVSTLIWGVLAF